MAGRARIQSYRQGSGGFTLTEILVAMALFMLGSVGVVAVFGAGVVTAREAMDTVDAATLLDSVLSDIRATYHSEPKYHSAAYPADPTGVPEQLLDANSDLAGGSDNGLPGRAIDIEIPPGWPGHYEIDSYRERPPLAQRMTYSVYFEQLPNTADPVTRRPTCVIAHVTVYWTRSGRAFSMEGSCVITLP